jgi:hypothetical protein
MSVKVSLIGPLFDPAAFAEIVDKAFRLEFSKLGQRVVQGMIARSPEYRGDWKRGFGITLPGYGFHSSLVIFNDSPDAPFVEEGRRPGKQPPPDVMLTWVLARQLAETRIMNASYKASNIGRGLKLSRSTKPRKLRNPDAEAKSIAFLIGRAIGRRGLPGFHLFRDFSEDSFYIDIAVEDTGGRIAQLANAASGITIKRLS